MEKPIYADREVIPRAWQRAYWRVMLVSYVTGGKFAPQREGCAFEGEDESLPPRRPTTITK